MPSPTLALLRVPNLHRIHQKVSKTVKKAVPPVFDPFSGRLRLPKYPPPLYGPSESQIAPVGSMGGAIWPLWDVFSRCGGLPDSMRLVTDSLGCRQASRSFASVNERIKAMNKKSAKYLAKYYGGLSVPPPL